MVEYVEIRTYTTPARLPPLTPSPRKRVSPFAPQSIYQTLIQQHNWTLFFLSTFLFASLRYLVNSLCEETVFIRPEWADLIDSNPLLEYVRIRSRRLGYNLSLVEEFCTAETKLDNCQLDWERILVDVPKLMALKELVSQCFVYPRLSFVSY